jgi:pyruvate dehydrogenase E2 component (dihydrolipoamide acetyltransferase)
VATGAPLIDFDSGTVVGSMPTSDEEFVESATVGIARAKDDSRARAVPVARALAKRLGLDLGAIEGSGSGGVIRLDDVLVHANIGAPRAPAGLAVPAGASAEPLRGARRAMAHSMSMSRDQISGSTVCDDADIHGWTQRGDYMLRLIRAMIAACSAEPALNAWYDTANGSRILLTNIDLAIAVDTPGGLIVPVLRNIRHQTPEELRAGIAAQKEAAHRRSTLPADLRDFTLMLSNFGTLAGRYGIPLVVPPAVAILGAGKVRQDAVVEGGSVVAHRQMPLSLSFDHRCVTGGEACRFLAAVIADLEKPD